VALYGAASIRRWENQVSSGRGDVVYIVEVDDAVRDALAILLQSAGYDVSAFGSANAFLDGYEPVERGCLLVDLDLPEMEGPQLVGILVARGIRLPAVLMSARMRNLKLKLDPPPGVVTILEKPFGDDQLLDRIEFAMDSPPC
jgi:two-component system response regulator FixJ